MNGWCWFRLGSCNLHSCYPKLLLCLTENSGTLEIPKVPCIWNKPSKFARDILFPSHNWTESFRICPCLSRAFVYTIPCRILTLVLLNPDIYCLYKLCRSRSVGFFKLAKEANWSRSALFAIKYVNLYQQCGSIDLIGWKFEKGVAS